MLALLADCGGDYLHLVFLLSGHFSLPFLLCFVVVLFDYEIHESVGEFLAV